MILESEVQNIEAIDQSKARLRKSVWAFCLFFVSVISNLPGYLFPVKYLNIVVALSGVSLLAILVAIALAVSNLLGYFRSIPFKNRKDYWGLSLNLIVVGVTGLNVILLLLKLKAGRL